MSNIGPIALEGDNDQMYLGGEYNEAADRIDTEVCKIINHRQIATEIVLDNRVVIDLAVEN
jgi:ATP-dependent Zn protease